MRRYVKALRALRKDTRIVIGAALLFSVGGPVALILSNDTSPIIITEVQPATVTVPFTKLTQGTQSAVARRVNYVLTSPVELGGLWRAVNAAGEPPKVDFKTHAVIAVFAGAASNAAIAVTKIEDTNQRLVSIAVTKLDGGCEIDESRSGPSPYEIVAVPATSLPLTHEDIETSFECK